MNAVYLIDKSPFIALAICSVFFVVEAFCCKIGITDAILPLIGYLVSGAVMGLLLAVLVVMGLTAYYNSAQGPLALFDFGPPGVAVGEILGAVVWRLRVLKWNG
ncbi:MAG: hypothetical protein K1564_09140 [Candidatus Thiodiazotropha sp. (ex. Lucinisca nassula)]|nr:hypothetical protein [Candidatus Thiodiazotropha sp. (ex. Lucinisca nassula)]